MHSLALDGQIPIRMNCFGLPLTSSFPINKLLSSLARVPILKDSPAFSFQEIVQHILRTIALGRLHLDRGSNEITVFGNVLFNYSSVGIWSVPPLAIQVSSRGTNDPVLQAGFDPFTLGEGTTTISAFTSLKKRETSPLMQMLKSLLAGNDLPLRVSGGSKKDECLLQQVLNEMAVDITIPGKLNNQPLFLQTYHAHIHPEKIDQEKRECVISAEVVLMINNPTPIDLAVDGVDFGVYFYDQSQLHPQETLLGLVNHSKRIAWEAHSSHNITFHTALNSFDSCRRLFGLLLKQQLMVSVREGNLRIEIAKSKLSVPFSIARIHIPWMDTIDDQENEYSQVK